MAANFVRLKDLNGSVVYINADRVTSVREYTDSESSICFEADNTVIIEMPVDEVVKMLQA